ncbi:MAG: flippase-like domain-containing protein [Dehalococcoidia bacterium]|nr:flippase-like domain-containing protein [Dehalococcoidia bacterium]
MSRPKRPQRLLIWVGAALGASAMGGAFVWFAFRKIDWGAVNHALARADVPYLFAALGFVLAAIWLRGLRWRLLFHGVSISTWRLVLVENTAVGVNSLTPIPVLDEPTRVGLLMLQGLPAGTVLATTSAMRVFELAAQATIGAIGLVLLPELRSLTPYIAAAAGVALLALIALFSIGPLLRHIPLLARLSIAHEFSQGVHVMLRAPLRTAAAFLLTGGYAIVIGLGGWMLGLAFDIELGMLAMIILSLAVISFTDWIPGLPGAIGTFEWVALYLLGLWGVDRSAALGFAILLHVLFFLPPLLIAVCYFPYVGIRSLGAVLSLVRQQVKEAAPGQAGGEVAAGQAPGAPRPTGREAS